MVTILVKGQDTVRVNRVRSSSPTRGLGTAGSTHCQGLSLRVRLGDGIKSRLLLERAAAAAAMVTAACLGVPFDSRLQVGTFAGFLAAVAFNVSGTRLAHGATVCALGYWSTLLIYMLKRAVRVLTIAYTMAANASLASIFLSVNYHVGGGCDLARLGVGSGAERRKKLFECEVVSV